MQTLPKASVGKLGCIEGMDPPVGLCIMADYASLKASSLLRKSLNDCDAPDVFQDERQPGASLAEVEG